jgi:hypothetical protein
MLWSDYCVLKVMGADSEASAYELNECPYDRVRHLSRGRGSILVSFPSLRAAIS